MRENWLTLTDCLFVTDLNGERCCVITFRGHLDTLAFSGCDWPTTIINATVAAASFDAAGPLSCTVSAARSNLLKPVSKRVGLLMVNS